MRSLRKVHDSAEPAHDSTPTAYTREQYDAMQNKAHELGMHLITPYRKGLKNIRVGVIKAVGSPSIN